METEVQKLSRENRRCMTSCMGSLLCIQNRNWRRWKVRKKPIPSVLSVEMGRIFLSLDEIESMKIISFSLRREMKEQLKTLSRLKYVITGELLVSN
jgi:hypothetical protein